MSFLPTNYKIPTNSNYMSWNKGSNRFRVLSAAITGYEYWNKDKKPVRLQSEPANIPTDIGYTTDKEGKAKMNPIRHFWAMVVWNYTDSRIQILEITQATIQEAITAYFSNPKWGDPAGYDLEVVATGDNFDRKYSVIAEPHSKLDEKIQNEWNSKRASINLSAMFNGEDPFKSTKSAMEPAFQADEYPVDNEAEEIPF